ncbi:MAG: substrate-binding and VWA domain-containing protein [Halothiobacillaceae bacterium]|nr:substrate-binding and VWA domain-containing protein [Halothiobacillaceae bacterium]
MGATRHHHEFEATAVKIQPIVILLIAATLGWTLYNANRDGRQDDTQALHVLAGSELKDIEPLLPQLEKETGVRLKLDYTGTLDGAEQIAQAGPQGGARYPLAWFSHAKYLELLESARGRIVAREKIGLSPVIIGVRQSLAQRWGWDRTPPSWSDLAARAASGELRYAMTNPTSSNTGFSALIALIAALSSDPENFTLSEAQQGTVKDFFKGQRLTAGSSGWLAEAYVRDQDRLDGLINYESILLQMNRSGQLREPLTLIYPREGVVTADYPLLLLDAGKRAEYDKVIAWLRRPEIQERLMRETDRRPILPSVALEPRFTARSLIELPFPGQRSVVDRILTAYLDEQRIPAHAYFVIDLSGSMRGEGIAALKTALLNLMGGDTSLTGQFARFRAREELSFVPFRDRVEPPVEMTIGSGADTETSLKQARDFAQGLDPTGGTAIYSALTEAYARIQQAQGQQPDHYYSIVLMTDGMNTAGIDLDQFIAYYRGLPEATRAVKIFPILFGEADTVAMQKLAEMTGGKVFDGNKNLAAAFKAIRGYQ